jgi:DNA mismatch repair protein MLH3
MFESKQERAIQPIPHPLRNRLRSAYLLNSFPQLVSELLQNSLDAKATDIRIGIDCDDWSCWVRDNGSGIDRIGLDVLAKAERYRMVMSF